MTSFLLVIYENSENIVMIGLNHGFSYKVQWGNKFRYWPMELLADFQVIKSVLGFLLDLNYCIIINYFQGQSSHKVVGNICVKTKNVGPT